MKIKTSELTGAALDWAVAKCENIPSLHLVKKSGKVCVYGGVYGEISNIDFPYQPSTDWAQGGPIIEREGIDLYCNVPTNPRHPDLYWRGSWRARYCRCGFGTEFIHGETALIAAMRCFVASKLGDEVEVPEELL